MKATLSCSVLAVSLTGCLGLLGSQKVNYKVPVSVEAGQVVAYKSIGSVGADQRKNAGIRIGSPGIAELDRWDRVVELTGYSPNQVCFRWTDYQATADQYGDGVTNQRQHADYSTAKLVLDTSSGAHYEATGATDVGELTFQYASYVTEEGLPPHWVPAVAFFQRSTVEACFDTAKPVADETSARWTIKGGYWELSFDFAFGGRGGEPTVAAVHPAQPAPAPVAAAVEVPAAPPPPETFIGRWGGEVAMTMAINGQTDSGTAKVTLAVAEMSADTVSVRFEGGRVVCTLRAKIRGKHATIAGGQKCESADTKIKTGASELWLSATGLQLTLELSGVHKTKTKTERGTISLSGELAAL